MANTPEHKTTTEPPCHAHKLRDALRDTSGKLSVDDAAIPLLAQCEVRLLRLCVALVRRAYGRIGADGEDLAQEAWRKTLIYIKGAGGERVQNDVHFDRILRCAAKSLFLDWLKVTPRPPESLEQPLYENEAASWTDRIADSSPTPEEWLVPADSLYLELIEILFQEPERFHKRFRQPNQRHPRQYQALVLYHMTVLYRDAAAGVPRDEDQMGYVENFVDLISISRRKWDSLTCAALDDCATVLPGTDSLYEHIINAVNRVCGTQVKHRKSFIAYRSEMNRFVEDIRVRKIM